MRTALALLMAGWTTLGAPLVCLADAADCCEHRPAATECATAGDACCEKPGDPDPTPPNRLPFSDLRDDCCLGCGVAVKLPDEHRIKLRPPEPVSYCAPADGAPEVVADERWSRSTLDCSGFRTSLPDSITLLI